MDGSSSLGKTLLPHTLHNILNGRSVDNFDTAAIALFLVPFIVVVSNMETPPERRCVIRDPLTPSFGFLPRQRHGLFGR